MKTEMRGRPRNVQPIADSETVQRRGRKPGGTNKFTRDLREGILDSWQRLGGVAYLTQIAKTHPAVYASLLARVIPAEVRHSFLGRYEALPVPVEQREPSPLIGWEDALGGTLDVIDVVPAPASDAAWLELDAEPAYSESVPMANGPMISDTAS